MDCRAMFYSNAVFSWKGGLSLVRSYFSSIFRIFKGLFKLDPLLGLTRNPHEEFCVIIAIIQDMYARIVGSYKIKIEDFNLFIIINHFNLFIIINHFSLHLLLSLHSSSQVKPTHVLFPLPLHRSLTLEPPTT